ncbi:MAG TPA: hypothetical protein PKV93_09630, partial [Fervidobacterium sp.]|nr:hypothetical protein [Fervidobacterium sp.]
MSSETRTRNYKVEALTDLWGPYRQDTLTFVCRPQNVFECIGGVPQIVLFDNAKTVELVSYLVQEEVS